MGLHGFLDVAGWSSGTTEKTGWEEMMREMTGYQSTWAWIPRFSTGGMAYQNAGFGRCLVDTGSGLKMEETGG